jgi:hypothetical protein
MTERYDQDIILGYVEGELTESQLAEFEAILADDHELRQLVSHLKHDRQALRGLGTQSAPVGLIDQVIQAHERAGLLGDPAAPEPMPRSMPVNRWKFRRVLSYGAVAAVLLLSVGLVVQTLIPPDILTSPHMAQYETDAGTSDNALTDLGSGLALLDEDAAYDEIIPGTPGRQSSAEKLDHQDASESAAAADESEITSERFALAEESDVAARSFAKDQASAQPAPALAMKNSDATPDQELTTLPVAKALQPGNAGAARSESLEALAIKESTQPPADAAVAEHVLARAAATEPLVLKKTASADAFAGYATTTTLAAPTQLLVESASPTQARRDIRDWAIANSVRLVENPPAAPGSPGVSEPVLGRRARAMAEATTLAGEYQAAGEARFLVEVDKQQASNLLAYMNRSKGQHAEMVTQIQDIAESGRDPAPASPRDNRMASRDNESTSEADAAGDADEQPKALANRLVDTHTGWDHGSLVRGMSPMTDSNTKHEVEAKSEESADQVKQQDQASSEPRRRAKSFDWGQLLEPRKPFSILTAPAPLLQSDTVKQLRLEVVIRQVADEPMRGVVTNEANQADRDPSKESAD